MKRYLCLSLLMLVLMPASTAARAETIARLIYPVFLLPAPSEQPPQVSLDNMRLGCKASAKSDTETAGCLAKIQKMSELAALTIQESLYAHLLAGKRETNKEAIKAFVISYRNTERIKVMRDQLFKSYPYVKYYIAQRQRINI